MVTDIKMNVPLHQLTEQVAECMRRNGIKRGSGSWDDYYRAIDIAMQEINTKNEGAIRERIYRWILPR